jgi:predicted O-methyltransferase YrrM
MLMLDELVSRWYRWPTPAAVDAIPPVWSDLHALYRVVRRVKPEIVVELGSGVSTSVIASALSKNGRGHVTNYDGEHHWSNEASWMVNRSSLDSWATCLVVPIIETTVDGRPAYEYVIPECPSPIDLLFIDGPPLIHAQITKAPPARVVVVDGRSQTVAMLANLRRQSPMMFGHDLAVFE